MGVHGSGNYWSKLIREMEYGMLGSDGNKSICNSGDLGSIPGSFLENPMD